MTQSSSFDTAQSINGPNSPETSQISSHWPKTMGQLISRRAIPPIVFCVKSSHVKELAKFGRSSRGIRRF